MRASRRSQWRGYAPELTDHAWVVWRPARLSSCGILGDEESRLGVAAYCGEDLIARARDSGSQHRAWNANSKHEVSERRQEADRDPFGQDSHAAWDVVAEPG